MITSYNLFLRTSQTNKDGKNTVCLRIVNNRKHKLFSLRIYLFQTDWNVKKGIVNRSDPQHYLKNKLIEKYRAKAQQIITDYLLADKNLTFADFEQHFFNNIYGTNSFYDFIEDELSKSKNELAKATLKGYHSQFRKLQRYRKELSFNEIDFTFLRSYELFLMKTNNQNTTNKALTFIKTLLNKAINQNIYKGENPFRNYPVSRVQGKRDYLTIHEVGKLQALLESDRLSTNRKNVLNYFLFCCYTGLRYSDIQLLKFKNILSVTHNNTEQNIINIDMHKTKKLVRIPIIRQADNLISYPKHFTNEMPVFNVMSSQPTNRYLKEIAKEAGIIKNVSFHVARHTFATNGLEFGIPLEVISQILGHSDLRTTQIYAKVSDKLKIEQMQKMEK